MNTLSFPEIVCHKILEIVFCSPNKAGDSSSSVEYNFSKLCLLTTRVMSVEMVSKVRMITMNSTMDKTRISHIGQENLSEKV